MFHNRTLPLPSEPCPNTPLKVQGIMRLAVKYEAEVIRATILKHIESEWPHTVEEWEKRRNDRERKNLLLSAETEDQHLFFPDPALAVRFAMEFGCRKILPAALYELIIAYVYDPEQSPPSHPSNVSRSCLHPVDLRLVIAGQRMLAGESFRIASTRWGCSCKVCSPIVQSCALDAFRFMRESDSFDTLMLLRSFHESLIKRFWQFCTPGLVRDEIQQAVTNKAEAIWDSLYSYYIFCPRE